MAGDTDVDASWQAFEEALHKAISDDDPLLAFRAIARLDRQLEHSLRISTDHPLPSTFTAGLFEDLAEEAATQHAAIAGALVRLAVHRQVLEQEARDLVGSAWTELRERHAREAQGSEAAEDLASAFLRLIESRWRDFWKADAVATASNAITSELATLARKMQEGSAVASRVLGLPTQSDFDDLARDVLLLQRQLRTLRRQFSSLERE